MSLTEAGAAPQRPRFHKVTIADVRRETDEAVSIAFQIPEALAPLFRYAPGQYLTLRAEIGGRSVRRTYSIASGLDEGEWRVAVKRVEGGVFSAFANEELAAGDTVELMPPAGRFVLPEPAGPRTVVAFAAGAGITPIASQIRTVLVREPQSRVFLFYANQTARSILFREAIEDLKDRYMARFSVHNVLSRESQDVDVLSGRIDGARAATFMRHVVPFDTVDHFLLCGPPPFLDTMTEALAELGVAADKVLLERFTVGAGDGRAASQAPRGGTGAALSLTLDGSTTTLRLAPGERVLDAALAAGLDAPYSCRAGMCCTCRAKIKHGKVAMAANYALRQDEVEEGFILTCQASATTDSIAVDYDEA